MVPRFKLEAVKEIRGRMSGYHEIYEDRYAWKETFDKESGLPKYEEVYGEFTGYFELLRTVLFIDSKREKEHGIGLEFPYDELPFGRCIATSGWVEPEEVEIFQFHFDFMYIISHYNQEAKRHNWRKMEEGPLWQDLITRIPCRTESVSKELMD